MSPHSLRSSNLNLGVLANFIHGKYATSDKELLKAASDMLNFYICGYYVSLRITALPSSTASASPRPEARTCARSSSVALP